MKKFMTAILGSTVVLGLLTGCGNSQSEPAATQGTTAKTEENGKTAEEGKVGGNVSWWTWSTEATDAFAKQIEYATTQNPNLTVDIQYTANADYMAKLPVAIAGGTGPDIYQMTRPSFELYAASGQAMDLTDAIANSPKLQEYFDSLSPEVKESYQFEGKQMAIPFTVESTAIAYNKDIFKEAGLPDLKEIEDTWTWDDLHEIAKKLTVKNEKGETVQYGFFTGVDRLPAWEFIWSHGAEMFSEDGEVCTLDDPKVAEALTPLVEMYQEGLSPSIDVTTTTSGDDIFISGQIAMIPAGIWKIPSYNNITSFEWDVVELPFDATTGKRVSSSNILGLFVNPNSKNKEAAIALLEELVQPECQKILADTHTYIPALESVRQGYFEGDVPDNIEAYKNALEYIHPNTLTQYVVYGQFNQEVADALKRAYNGEMTIEQSMKETSDKINAIMEENKAQFQ
jgi:multiple sugar transport system substrate-binding protein